MQAITKLFEQEDGMHRQMLMIFVGLFLFCIGGCSDEESQVATDEPETSNEETAAGENPPAPATSPQDTPAKTAKQDGCSADGRICLVVTLEEGEPFRAKAEIKNGADVDSEAVGTVVFIFASFYDGNIEEEYFDNAGEYHDVINDADDAEISISVQAGEAVLYGGNALEYSDFTTNVHNGFILKATYITDEVEHTAQLTACQFYPTITDCS